MTSTAGPLHRPWATTLVLLAACTPQTEPPPEPQGIALVRRISSQSASGWREPHGLPNVAVAQMTPRRMRDQVRRVALPGASGAPDERLAIVTPPGTRIDLDVRVPRDAVLELALAGVGPSETVWSIAGTLAISADGEETTLLSARRTGHPLARWEPKRVDLSRWSGRSVRLTFAAGDGDHDALLAWATPLLRTARPRERPWSLLLISLDTVRADHLGSYGHDRNTSPNLDEFASRAYRFAQAISPAPWTHPAHRSLFTGLYPQSHGGARRVPLAQVLWHAGFDTAAVAGGGQLDYRMGFSRGFERYREEDWIRSPAAMAEEISALAGRPFFFFLHTYEPHDPYLDTRFAEALPAGRLAGEFSHQTWRELQKELTPDEKSYIEALYDGDIAFTDEGVGDLLTLLDRDGVLDHTIVVVTSDHGEQFWEHGTWRHGQSLHDHQLMVPLVLRVPPALATRFDLAPQPVVIAAPVRLIDVYPTVLELLGIEIDRKIQGRSLLPLLAGTELREEPALAEDLNLHHEESKAVRYRGLKLISHLSADGAETRALYDLELDPGEQRNVIDERRDAAERLQSHLQRLAGSKWWQVSKKGTVGRDLPDDLRRRLEALGYLGD